MNSLEIIAKLESMGFNGTGYRLLSNDPIGGYAVLCILKSEWTLIYIERGQIDIIKKFFSERDGIDYMTDQGKVEIVRFNSVQDIFHVGP